MARNKDLLLAVLGVATVCQLARANDTFTSIGLTQLRTQLGARTPTGAGVTVAQVEASFQNGPTSFGFLPDRTWTQFTGKTITNSSPGYFSSNLVSAHASNVATTFYGNYNGVAPGVTSILAYQADSWLSGDFLRAPSANGAPKTDGAKVQNHSWVSGNLFTDEKTLQKLDYAISRDDIVVVCAVNNGSAVNLLASGANSIAVGVSGGGSASGVTSVNGSGRVKPDIVVPDQGATSDATPHVAGSAALLVQTATTLGQSAGTDHRVIKSVLMAGTTKGRTSGNITGLNGTWSQGRTGNVITRPLDSTFGAGQLNMLRSYNIMSAGQQPASPTALVSSTGWDRQSTATGGRTYFFNVPAGSSITEFSASLNWDMVNTPDNADFTSFTRSLANLNLALYSANGVSLGSLLWSSQSSVDNLEYLYINPALGIGSALPAGNYALQVTSGTANVTYGLAWQSVVTVIPEPIGLAWVALMWAAGVRRVR